MDMNEYQARAVLTSAVKGEGRARKTHAGLELASELLELGALLVSSITKSQFRPKGKSDEEYRTKVLDELSDHLWNLANTAASFGFQLSDVAKHNLSKVGGKHADLLGNGVVPKLESPGRIPAKPEDPFPWVKGNKKSIKTCPKCAVETVFKEGCVSCPAPDCGWSSC
jgi:hypothetical protein